MNAINTVLTVPSLDPEDARRRKLLNILLFGIGGLTFVTLIVALITLFFGPQTATDETTLFFIALGVMLVGTGVVYAINRFWSGYVASTLMLLIVIGVLSISDAPQEVVNGRTLFLFTIPVFMSSVLLRPWSSFIAAGVVGVALLGVSLSSGVNLTSATVAGFFALALIAWLAARSLDNALRDLRAINEELDQRVIERTQELAVALNRVQAEANKNQAILESITDAVIVFDNNKKAMVVNPSAEKLLHQPVDHLLGRTLKDMMQTARVNPGERDDLLEAINTESHASRNLRVTWGQRTLSVNFGTVLGTSEVDEGKVVVFRDYTSEAELEQMKSAFVSMASHELRTPLNAIIGYSDMIREGAVGEVTDAQTMTLDRITANGSRMLNLVNNLLDSAQIEAGQLHINEEPFIVAELLEDAQATMRVLATQKDLELACDIDDQLPTMLVCDPDRLRQILINLIGNAVKFTEEGSVHVNAALITPETWSISVVDTGIGIPDDAQEYVFESFRQVKDPLTRSHGGSGLGLSIVKQLVNLLGGEITLQSTVGVGSTFTITLPVVVPEKELSS